MLHYLRNPCLWSGLEHRLRREKATYHLVETNLFFTHFIRLSSGDEVLHLHGKSHSGLFLSDTMRLCICGDSVIQLLRVMPGGRRALEGLVSTIQCLAQDRPTSDMTRTSHVMPPHPREDRSTIFVFVKYWMDLIKCNHTCNCTPSLIIWSMAFNGSFLAWRYPWILKRLAAHESQLLLVLSPQLITVSVNHTNYFEYSYRQARSRTRIYLRFPMFS